MACNCPNIDCVLDVDTNICTCTTILNDINCPVGYTAVMQLDGNAVCQLFETEEPIIEKVPVYFDNTDYFEDVSWTIAFKPSEGTWNSYFSFYPDYTLYHNNFFQIGYNWGVDKGTLWNHNLGSNSFCVFQGKKHKPIIEYIIPSENANKMLNSISLNLEGRYHINEWDFVLDKNKSFKNMFIYNQTNNSGMLELVPQKSLTDNRKYPITEGNIQKILFSSDGGSQNINYFFNRNIKDTNNLPMFKTDRNNIFKTINNSAVSFSGKRLLERLKGDYFSVHLEGIDDSRFNLILKNSISDENILD